jgi:hypothetical protein
MINAVLAAAAVEKKRDRRWSEEKMRENYRGESAQSSTHYHKIKYNLSE